MQPEPGSVRRAWASQVELHCSTLTSGHIGGWAAQARPLWGAALIGGAQRSLEVTLVGALLGPLLAADTTTATDLNARARTTRVAAGQVSAQGLPLRDGTTAGIGDLIRTRHNTRGLTDTAGHWIRNGDPLHVATLLPDGRVLYELRHRWRDGTTHVGFLPLEFIEKLLALKDDGPAIIAVNPRSMLGSKMVKEAYGVAGGDLRIGAEILCRAALSDEFADASGKYFDNDTGRFASPHPDALNAKKCEDVVREIEAIIAEKGNND